MERFRRVERPFVRREVTPAHQEPEPELCLRVGRARGPFGLNVKGPGHEVRPQRDRFEPDRFPVVDVEADAHARHGPAITQGIDHGLEVRVVVRGGLTVLQAAFRRLDLFLEIGHRRLGPRAVLHSLVQLGIGVEAHDLPVAVKIAVPERVLVDAFRRPL